MTKLDPIKTFTLKAPWIMAKLREDFGLTEEQAAGILGNLGAESGGFTQFQELNPTVRGSRGGFGWAQWTGPRRFAFEAYCDRNRLDPRSDKANYAYLFLELKGPEKRALTALKRAETLRDAVVVFEQTFERAGVKHYRARHAWAERALAAYRAADRSGLVPPHNPKPPPITKKEEHMETVKNTISSKTMIGLAAAFAAPYLAKYGVTEAGTAALIQDAALAFAAFGRFVAAKSLGSGAPLAS